MTMRFTHWVGAFGASAILSLAGCVAGGGGGGGSGGRADAGACDPVAGEYTMVWSLDDADSDDDCLDIDPRTMRLGDDRQASADCPDNCTCEQTFRVDDHDTCSGTATTECADEDDQTATIVYCTYSVSGGDVTFRGRCELELYDTAAIETLGYCAHDVTFTRTGD